MSDCVLFPASLSKNRAWSVWADRESYLSLVEGTCTPIRPRVQPCGWKSYVRTFTVIYSSTNRTVPLFSFLGRSTRLYERVGCWLLAVGCWLLTVTRKTYPLLDDLVADSGRMMKRGFDLTSQYRCNCLLVTIAADFWNDSQRFLSTNKNRATSKLPGNPNFRPQTNLKSKTSNS